MDLAGDSVMEISVLLISVIIGATVLVLCYINNSQKTHKADEGKQKKDLLETVPTTETVTSVSSTKQSKKRQSAAVGARWRSEKAGFTHPWLLSTLKGHTGRVTDIDFSNNGKFLATCAEDPPLDSGGAEYTGSSGSECPGPELNSRSSSTEHLTAKGGTALSRRQRKNRLRADNSPVQTRAKKNKTKVQTKKNTMERRNQQKVRNNEIWPPLLQHIKLNLPEYEIYKILWAYVLEAQQQYVLGYPMESSSEQRGAVIYKEIPRHQPYIHKKSYFDVNAREFIPARRNYYNSHSASNAYPKQKSSGHGSDHGSFDSVTDSSCLLSGDSGQGSGSSSPQSIDSDSCEQNDIIDVQKYVTKAFNNNSFRRASKVRTLQNDNMKRCARCAANFLVNENGEYLAKDPCVYHHGKVSTQVFSTHVGNYVARNAYSCCNQEVGLNNGCTRAALHVWSGVVIGENGPYDDFVCTPPPSSLNADGYYGVYAVDCEMCYTGKGLELTKVTLVATDGRLVYDAFVKPDNDIIDYNTTYSGITAKDLSRKGVKNLKDVQNDLLKFINAYTVLVGHGLENDLRALKLIHGAVVDTSVVYNSKHGFPFRSSLKEICLANLKREIQQDSDSGHNSFEDARATMELMLYRIKKDCRSMLEKRY